MLLSAVSVLVVAQSSSEIPEGLMNNLVCKGTTVLALELMVTLCLKTFLIVQFDVCTVENINVVFVRGVCC